MPSQPVGGGVDLFQHARRELLRQGAPLATRMRPRTLDEVLGQDHLVGSGRPLRRALEAGHLPSMVLWGPPGSGKTTLALLMAERVQAHFEALSAVTAGVADLRRVVESARRRLGEEGRRTVLFVDEIHRFNRAQQAVVLPAVEEGEVVLIGATTENPSFEVIGALLSRCRVFALRPLSPEAVRALLERALRDEERGLGRLRVRVEESALDLLARACGGDARVALNALELCAYAGERDGDGRPVVTLALAGEVLQQRAYLYDKAGDQHYDTISAFIKSVRSSDPDASIYYLARMLEAGEDPLYIARRLVILASEDIGLADPQALPMAVSAFQAVHFLGLPEGAIPLAEATLYLASAPKSNSAYLALKRAQEDVRAHPNLPVPLHLRNPVTPLMERMGYGKGYRYAHDYPEHFVRMENLPEALRGRRYYEPTDQGAERAMGERLRRWWGARGEAGTEDAGEWGPDA